MYVRNPTDSHVSSGSINLNLPRQLMDWWRVSAQARI